MIAQLVDVQLWRFACNDSEPSKNVSIKILGRTWIDYKTRLIWLGVDSLEMRWPRRDLLHAYKVLLV